MDLSGVQGFDQGGGCFDPLKTPKDPILNPWDFNRRVIFFIQIRYILAK